MAELSTSYLGLKLKNPIIAAASGLTATVEGVRKAAGSGAGAITLKSLFEEQLRADLNSAVNALDGAHPEAAAFLESMGVHGGANEYLDLIRASVAAVDVPVIASVNCIEGELWVDFAEQIQAAGAAAIELNIAVMPRSTGVSSKELEDQTVDIVRNVSVRCSLPIAVKIGPYFTNPANLVERLSGAGAAAVVLFNRFYRLDLDLDEMKLTTGPMRSGEDEYHESLRWIASLYGAVPCELVGGTGVHSGETALKLIAGGATAVQVCSAVYRGGWTVLSRMVSDMSSRLDALGVPSVGSLRGTLARRSSVERDGYERLQYVKALTGIS